ncbi:hypothetical protein X878_0073 [Enterococcus phage VD13]|uniref:Uncharacterized protein n=1 Tax=Enterococcus phage VD13 TaxID=1458851 RepID=X2KQH0_9CAUD|nr:hypothetical protein X878_0073 [Enterococcus phage VD13]YP_009592515.1 hypothetical protein FDG77_gp74 [Enterococcus phage VD13]AHL19659.1 hypothetical protein VD13_074 [Enterococcus phage VD13]AHN83161.1 hypothetical protein X878_0073 [Enterococcus phage VD13]
MLIKKEKKAYLFTIYGLHSYPFVIGVDAYSDSVAIERFYKIWRKHYPKHYKKHKEFSVKKFDI